MICRKALPLLPLCLLAACAGHTESGQSLAQAEQSGNADEDVGGGAIRHVLLISVDGLHATDVTNFVAAHADSTFAQLAGSGLEFTDAHTATPSDSFPGMVALVTGATPRTSGVYYDDSYDRTLYAPGGTCTGNAGTEVVQDESIEQDDSQLFSPINPNNLPHAKDTQGNCIPVFPHQFIKVNTVFEVIRAAGGHTAWSDKHPAYDLLNGPSGTGIADLYTPEINSLVKNGGTVQGIDLAGTLAQCDGTTNSLPTVTDYTTCQPSVTAYDDVKVQAVINEIDGLSSDGSKTAPVPTIFGMNFQQVSVGEKLPVGGYADASGTPSALLEGALAHVDGSLGRMVSELKIKGLLDSTLIIVSAKHGQSPVDRAKLHMESGGRGTADVQDPLGFINAVDPNVDQVLSTFVNPNSGNQYAIDGHLQTDDVGIVWLQNQSVSNVAGVVGQLHTNAAAIEASTLPPDTIFDSNIVSGRELVELFGDPTSGDPVAAARAPNVFIQPNWGVIYSGSHKKIAEHGGGSPDDTNVGLIVSNPALRHRTVDRHVSTTQVAPTILRALGLDPDALDGVRKEGTKALPGMQF